MLVAILGEFNLYNFRVEPISRSRSIWVISPLEWFVNSAMWSNMHVNSPLYSCIFPLPFKLWLSVKDVVELSEVLEVLIEESHQVFSPKLIGMAI